MAHLVSLLVDDVSSGSLCTPVYIIQPTEHDSCSEHSCSAQYLCLHTMNETLLDRRNAGIVHNKTEIVVKVNS